MTFTPALCKKPDFPVVPPFVTGYHLLSGEITLPAPVQAWGMSFAGFAEKRRQERILSAENNVQRRLAAIMFSDICGYSLIMGRDEAQAMRILARHDEIMNGAITTFDGNIIKRMGDGLLAEFHSAVAAVECALAIQRTLLEKNARWLTPDQFQVRIGMHLGDVLVSGKDILGDGVNVASRIEPLAPPGGICISQDVYNQVHNKVEMQIVSLGPQQLKNIERQVEIYRVLVAAADGNVVVHTTAPAASPKSRRTWLIVAAAAVLALLLSAGIAAKRQRVRERQCVRIALRQADELLAQNDGSKARSVLEKAQQSVRPTTPGLDQVQARLARAKDMELTAALRKRFDGLTEAIARKDWDAAAQFADPDSKMRHGTRGISGRMALVGLFANILKIKPEDYRIREIHLNDNRSAATVIPELRVNGVWNEQKPGHWKRVDGEWCCVVE